jgi:hypothetical protein
MVDRWEVTGCRKVSDITYYSKEHPPRCRVCYRVIKDTVWDMRRVVPDGFDGEEIEVGPECKNKLERGEQVEWRHP